MANLDHQINMQQDGGDQQEDSRLAPPTTQFSPLTPLVATGGIQQQSLSILTIQDRIKSVMSDFKFFCQFWVHVKVGDQFFLTTSDQPYSCCEYHDHRYREVSSAHMYSVDIGKVDQLGPPGRVFLQGWPEFSPNVKYYSTKEYHLRDYALRYGVKKYCALPIFDLTEESLACVGVLELLANDEEDYIGNMCTQILDALEAAGLASSNMSFCRCRAMKIYALPCLAKEGKMLVERVCKEYSFPIGATEECQDILHLLYKEHSLIMARAWALRPSKYPKAQFGVHESHSRQTENSFCTLMGLCASKFNMGLCVEKLDENDDPHELSSLLLDCTSLREGQGLIGKAYASCKSCFCKDITQFSTMDYPFVHYARECELTGCFAIFLQSIDPRFDNYVLELFLTPEGTYFGDPQALLQSMLDTMAPHLYNFKVADGGQEELEGDLIHEVHLFSSNDNVDYFQISQSRRSLNEYEVLKNEGDQSKINASKEVENTKASHVEEEERQVCVTNSKKEDRVELEGKTGDVGDGITFELVEQQFGKKLEDAAKKFEVSRSTFKRKLRQLGINRWPSHKRTNPRFVGEELIGDYPTGSSKSNAVLEKGRSAADTAMQDKSTMDIKAAYEDGKIRFPLSFTSGIKDLKCEIEKRLNLQSYIIKYKDEDNDWILMACNDDLRHSMQNQKELGKTLLELLLVRK